MSGRIFPMLRAVGGPEGELDIGEMMMHHLVDAHEIELPFVGAVHLPQWEPVHLGPVTIDFSPTKHVIFLAVAAFLVALILILGARGAKRAHQEGAKRGPRGVTNVVEAFVLFLRDEVALPNIGHGGERYVPFIVTLFFFILFANLLGLVPWGATATGNISVTAALAFLSFLMTEMAGMRELGFKGYLGTIFFAPKGLHPIMRAVMLVIMTPVELLGKFTKPFALAIRLFANMNAGHLIILALIGLILMATQTLSVAAASALGPLVMAVGIMVLELFVAFLQAYIFSTLTSVFIGMIRHSH